MQLDYHKELCSAIYFSLVETSSLFQDWQIHPRAQQGAFFAGSVKGSKQWLAEKHEVLRQELDESRARRRCLKEELYQYERQTGKWSSWIYLGIYILVELGAMLIFVYGFSMVLPALPVYFAAPSSLIMLAPSYFVSKLYKGSPQKDRCMRRLNILGICFGFATLMFLGATVLLAYQISESFSSAGSFLSSNAAQSGFGLEDLQIIAAVATFICVIVTENLYAGRLLVARYKSREVECPRDNIEHEELPELERAIEELERECRNRGQQLAEIDEFPKVTEVWIKAKVEELRLLHRMLLKEMASEGLDEISQRPAREIIQIAKTRRG